MTWQAVIGLEIHVQLATETKAFCRCANRFGDAPNSHVCPVCLGLPGALPVPNREMVDMALSLAVALGAKVDESSRWARKNYFYPDLPKGYQITQYDRPLATGGALPVRVDDGRPRSIAIQRLHMEEDAGKSLHSDGDSFIDFNRCGVPLAEVVTAPVLHSPEDAASCLKALRALAVRLGICEGNLEKGSLRCDANVSVRREGEHGLRQRSEIKNLNSFRFLRQALDFEIKRHIAAYEAGESVAAETRLYDPRRGATFTMRSKEKRHDYRYFLEPDLPPVTVDPLWSARAATTLPELPWETYDRFLEEYHLPPKHAAHLADETALAAYFERVAALTNPAAAAKWITGDLTALWHERGKGPADCPIGPSNLTELIQLVANNVISGKIAKDVLVAVADGEGTPREIVDRKGLEQISDEGRLRKVVSDVLATNPTQWAQFREGKEAVASFLVGKVMQRTAGRANPTLVQRLLRERIDT